MKEADVVYMAVGIQTKQFGLGAGKAADLTAWEHNARRLAPCLVGDSLKVVVELSTVAVKVNIPHTNYMIPR